MVPILAPNEALHMAVPNPPARLTTQWLLDTLHSQGGISAKQRAQAAQQLAASKEQPLVAIGQIGLSRADQTGQSWTTEKLSAWLAEQAGMRYLRIDPLKLDPQATAQALAYGYARRAQLLVIRLGKDLATIACADPFDLGWVQELERTLERKIQPVLANPADIQRYLLEFHSLLRASKDSNQRRGGAQVLENLVRIGNRESLNEDDQHIVGVVDWLLQYAFENRASDIHMEPRRGVGRLRLRIDGVLHDIYQLPENVFAAVCSRLKILAGCNLVERRRPQDGRIKSVSPEGREVELRLSTLPTAFGEKLVLRIFDPELVVQGLGEIGLGADQLKTWNEMCTAPHGLILVTGPTGSGKTTTLYATLRALANPRRNICTVEDPIELIEPRINQTQVNPQMDLGFAQGLRALLRQDPDVIMVGEIRDRATTEVALQAALTGHLVLATLHTNTAAGAIVRLLELGAPAYLLRATLLGVLAQRLVRRLCTHCKRDLAGEDIREAWTLLQTKEPLPARVAQAPGCLECRETGYRGRMGLYEILRTDHQIRKHITDDTELGELSAAVEAQGLRTLRDAGAEAVAAGKTSLDEILHHLLF